MTDMYDKLGDLLNQALENGKIPNENAHTRQTDEDRDFSENNMKSGLFNFKNQKEKQKNEQDFEKSKVYTKNKDTKKQKNQCDNRKNAQKHTATVIKMYKYTQNIQFPIQILHAMYTLDIVYPFTSSKLKSQYRIALKKHHPDTSFYKSTIQNTENVYKNRQFSIDEIQTAYEILKNYFGIK